MGFSRRYVWRRRRRRQRRRRRWRRQQPCRARKKCVASNATQLVLVIRDQSLPSPQLVYKRLLALDQSNSVERKIPGKEEVLRRKVKRRFYFCWSEPSFVGIVLGFLRRRYFSTSRKSNFLIVFLSFLCLLKKFARSVGCQTSVDE